MKLDEFISKFDMKGAIVLLEGKRRVKEEDKIKLFTLGKILASQTTNILFRSGNAGGSDEFFAKGVCEINAEKLQLILPFKNFRKKSIQTNNVVSLEDIDLKNSAEVVNQSRKNKDTAHLIDPYLDGKKGHIVELASYIIRDSIKVLGAGDVKPATFGLFYDDLEKPMDGGTGHTMKTCIQYKVPIADQRIWFNWI